jgi:hypothetical protein
MDASARCADHTQDGQAHIDREPVSVRFVGRPGLTQKHPVSETSKPTGLPVLLYRRAHEWVADVEPGEPTEIAIRRPQFADAMLPAQGGDARVVYLGPGDAGRLHQGTELGQCESVSASSTNEGASSQASI